MAAAEAEVTLICMDNSLSVFSHDRLYHGQIAAIRFYCETIFKCNPENTVGLFSMASKRFGPLLTPRTRDLKKILSSVEDVRYDGEVEFSLAVSEACSILSSSPPNMKKRLLMFVGGRINLQPGESKPFVTELKDMGVALDVVNFFLLDIDPSYAGYSILYGTYRYAKELDALVSAVDNNDNSHIVDVEDESSVIHILSNSILKKSLHYLKKKDAADEEYVEASGAQFVKPELERFHNEKIKSSADDEYLQAPGIKYLSNKNPRLPRKKNQKKPKEKVNAYTRVGTDLQ